MGAGSPDISFRVICALAALFALLLLFSLLLPNSPKIPAPGYSPAQGYFVSNPRIGVTRMIPVAGNRLRSPSANTWRESERLENGEDSPSSPIQNPLPY